MGARLDTSEAIFESAGQAVHVAFVVMAHEPTQDGPLRKALIRVMESIRLSGAQQRQWLDQLRGEASERIHFGGLSSTEIRAQCAMITEVVKTLPAPEMWALQAKYGFTEVDEMGADEAGLQQLVASIQTAEAAVRAGTARLATARAELDAARQLHLACEHRITTPAEEKSRRDRYFAARDDVRDISLAVIRAESSERSAKIALDRMAGRHPICNGPAVAGVKRRFVFSPERIAAIQGLSDWFSGQLPRIKPFAIDFLLGRIYAKHSQVNINFRDMAQSFGGNHMNYFRAHCKIKNALRQLEEKALERLEPRLVQHAVVMAPETA